MSEESHEKQFRGIWLPFYILELYEEKQINDKQLILLAIIDCLSKGDEGCFASNEYLAKAVNTTATKVSVHISHLKKLGVIRATGFNGRQRFLATCWSETPESSGQKGKAGFPKRERQHSRFGKGSIPEKGKAIYKEEDNIENRNSLSGPDGPDNDTSKTSRRKEPSTFDYRAAQELAAVIETHQKLNKRMKPKDWANTIRVLREHDGVEKKDIRDVIRWYKDHIGQEYIPVVLSAAAFRDKWEKLVAARMRTTKQEQKDRPARATPREKLARRVRDWLTDERGLWLEHMPTQEEVDEALTALGHQPGEIDWEDVE